MKYFVYVLAFVFTLPKLNIQVFTICKNICILNWTKSENPNFRVSREMEIQLCWKEVAGFGKIDFGAIQYLMFVTICLSNFCGFLCKCFLNKHNYHAPNLHMPLPCVREQPHSWSFFMWHSICGRQK